MDKLKIKVFIIHTKIVSIRKPMIDTLIKKFESNRGLSVEYEYVFDYEADAIPADFLKQNVVLSKDESNPLFDKYLKNIHIKQVSNSLKHYTALKKGIDSKCKADYILIIEDDVLFGEDIDTALINVLNVNKAAEWDVMFLGQPIRAEDRANIVNNEMKLFNINDSFEILPCCDSYIIKKTSLSKLVDSFLPIRYSTNIHLSSIFRKNTDLSVKSVWPNLFLDGSKFGVYISSIETNNRLFLNPSYNSILMKIVSDQVSIDDPELLKEISDFKFQNHPDFKYLTGVFEIKRKNYEKAKEIFEECYGIYEANNTILNGESEFLFNYINLFKNFQ